MLLNLGRSIVPLFALAMFGCQQPVKWSLQPKVEPDPVKAGKDFTILCKVTGDMEKVGAVSAIPVIAPEYTLEMNDEGTSGDAEKGDGIFTHKQLMPDNIDPGEYELEFVAYDKEGNPIEVPSFQVLDRDGKKILKEVSPQTEGDKKATGVELATILTVKIVAP